MIGADWLIRYLEEAGCDRLFTVPGSSMVSLLHALQFSDIEVVPALHEPAAVAMADGHSRIKGLTPLAIYMTPGATSAMSNLYNAWCDESPVLTVCSQQSSVNRSPASLSVGESDLVALVRETSRFAWEVGGGSSLGERVAAATRAVVGPPSGPAFLAIPQDVLEGDVGSAPEPWTPTRARVAPAGVLAVVERLRAARRPAIVVGGQLQRDGGEADITSLAEALGAPVFYEPFWNDRLAVAPHHPLVLGELTKGSSIAADADVVLAVGCRLFHEIHPRVERWFAPGAFIVHVNADQEKLDPHWGASWTCAASPAAFASAVLDELRRDPVDPAAREASERRVHESRGRRHQRRATVQIEAVEGLRYALEVGYVVDESVSVNNDLLAAFVSGPAERYISTSGGSLGWSLGAACGVALASGERVTCVLGDGAFFFGLQSLWNATSLQLPIVIVVFDNGGFGSTRYFEELYVRGVVDQDRRRPGYLGSDFRTTRPPVADVARSFGLRVVEVDEPGALGKAYEQALDASGPVLVHVPMPF